MRFLALMIPLVLTSCASNPSQKEISKHDCGGKPDKINEISENYVKANLLPTINPEFEHKGTKKSFTDYTFESGEIGWVHCGTAKPKNKNHGYGFLITICNGRIVDAQIGGKAYENCSRIFEQKGGHSIEKYKD